MGMRRRKLGLRVFPVIEFTDILFDHKDFVQLNEKLRLSKRSTIVFSRSENSGTCTLKCVLLIVI